MKAMALFAVSFRIHDNSSYERRYDSVVDAIRDSTTSTYWRETTSFFLVTFRNSSEALINKIIDDSLFDEKVDLLVVINLSSKAYQVRGQNNDQDLKRLMDVRSES